MVDRAAWCEPDTGTVDLLLWEACGGDQDTMDEVFALVYRELKTIASAQRRKSKKGSQTLNTTALVHEAWVRLHGTSIAYENRRHFLGIAARVMHQVLIDQARKNLSIKRGGKQLRITLRPDLPGNDESLWMLELDEALGQLGEKQPRLRDLFQLRYFLGLTGLEVAEVLNVSGRTVQRDWIKIRAFMASIMDLAQ